MVQHYDAVMRTTVDLPDDLHRLTTELARANGETLSQTIARILRRQLFGVTPSDVQVDAETGLPLVRLGRPITPEDVARAEEE
jgi:hypothetical protein